MVWYARAAPSPIPEEPMLTIGSDGEYRLWRDGTRLEAVRDHNWHRYYGDGARRNRTRLRPVTYYDGKSDFWRRQHLGIWMVFGPVFLLQRGLPPKKIGEKTTTAASKLFLKAVDGPDGHPAGGVLFAETRESYTQQRRLQEGTTALGTLRRVNFSERAHGTRDGTTYSLPGLNSIVCSDPSARPAEVESTFGGILRNTRLKAGALHRGRLEEGTDGWKDRWNSRIAPACWTDRDTALVTPASYTRLTRPVATARIPTTTLADSMAEAWDVARTEPLYASYSPCVCLKCRRHRRDKGASGYTAGTSKGHLDGGGAVAALDTQQGTSVAKVRIDVWDGGGGTLVGPVRWMDSGPLPAIPAASTHLHCEEPQCLTAARTSKHMDLAGTDGAATTGAVAWRTSSSTSQLGAGAALDRPRTVVIHGRKL